MFQIIHLKVQLISFKQFCFDADDYDNGLFLDSLVDHDAAAINGPIIQNGEINNIINPTNFRFCQKDVDVPPGTGSNSSAWLIIAPVEFIKAILW